MATHDLSAVLEHRLPGRSVRRCPQEKSQRIQEFEQWIQVHGPQVKASTARTYRRMVRRFFADRSVSHVGRRALEKWRDDLLARELAPNTINVQISALRAFFAFAQATGLRRDNPAEALQLRRVPRRIPRPVCASVMQKLLDTVANPQTDDELQDRAILETLYGSGLRREEVGRLRLENVLDRNTLRIVGKGDRERRTIITDPQWDALRDWALVSLGDEECREVEGRFGNDAAFDDLRKRVPMGGFFITTSGLRTVDVADPGQFIWQRLRARCEEAGVEATPHRLRHTFATGLLNKGVDIRVVQDLMGHQSINTTAGYTAVLNEALVAAKHAHPRHAGG